MLLILVPGQPSGAYVDHASGERGRSCFLPPAFVLLGRGVF